MAQYAQLDDGHTVVVKAPIEIDPAIYSVWVANGNPKASAYLPITDVAKPSFNAATQQVVQNGWTISPTDVQASWSVQALDAATQASIAGQTDFQTVLAGNVVTALTAADNNWATLTALQKDNVAHLLVKVIKALLRSKFGVNT
jgi:hypothetical protein